MTITNKYIVWLLVKTLRLKPYSVEFLYEKRILDPDVTKLGFLNQAKNEFNHQVDLYNDKLDKEIKSELKKPEHWSE